MFGRERFTEVNPSPGPVQAAITVFEPMSYERSSKSGKSCASLPCIISVFDSLVERSNCLNEQIKGKRKVKKKRFLMENHNFYKIKLFFIKLPFQISCDKTSISRSISWA